MLAGNLMEYTAKVVRMMNRLTANATRFHHCMLFAAVLTLTAVFTGSTVAQRGGSFLAPAAGQPAQPPQAAPPAPTTGPQIGGDFPGFGGGVEAKPVSNTGVPNFGAGELKARQAQLPFNRNGGVVGQRKPLNVMQLGVGGAANAGGSRDVNFSGKFMIEKGKRHGILSVRAVLAPGYHIYSLTQPAGGPLPTTIDVVTQPENLVKITSGFEPDKDPVLNPGLYPDPTEEHHGTVIWTARIELAEGVKPEELSVKAVVNGQICKTACEPIENRRVHVAYGGSYEQKKPSGQFKNAMAESTVQGALENASVAPGGKTRLKLTFTPTPGFYLYSLEDVYNEDLATGSPTLIVFQKKSGLDISRAYALTEAVEGKTGDHYEGPVTFVADIEVPADTEPGVKTISGVVGYQNCSSDNCTPPVAFSFTAHLTVGEDSQAAAPLMFASATYNEAAESAAERKAREPVGGLAPEKQSIYLVLFFSFIGGLILNLMPCVLPVIGLKVLGFAQQAGQSRSKIMLLNVVYSVGMISVFMVLATLAAFANLGWGEQFGYTWFKVAMTVLVFAMALSFLGVWEISLPGFMGGETASKLQSKGGLGGAFFKGMFTTLLATPCSGPFLGSAFGWTLSQPPVVTYMVFGSVGLGMASPYLVLGAFPSLISFIPKPGQWMETFKEVLAFVLLGTVVYLFSTITEEYYIATLALIVGVWFACWWVGRLSFTMNPQMRSVHWLGAASCAAAIGLLAFMYLTPGEEKLPWKPYSPATLAQARAEGKTVLVDFTADWCPTCKFNLANAIETDDVAEAVEDNNVVTLIADYTTKSEEIKQQLNALNSKSIPLLVVYPAGKPDSETIVLRDLVTKSQVVDAIKQAGPSIAPEAEPSTSSTATAMKESASRDM